MTQLLGQQFWRADTTQKAPVRTIDFPGTSLEDTEDMSPNSQCCELNELPDFFPPVHDIERQHCIVLCPEEIDNFTEGPQSNKSIAVTRDSTLGTVENRTPQNTFSTSASWVPFASRNVENYKSKNKEIQQRILDLLLEAKDKHDEVLALQLKAEVKHDEVLALQLEAKEKDDKILELQRETKALQLEAKEKDDKMLTLQEEMLLQQQQALDRLALIHKQGTAILTQTYELHEYPIPRLFIVLPKNSSKLDIFGHLNDQFRLYFLCECGEHTKKFGDNNMNIPHNIHLAKHEGYDLRRPKEFFQKYGRYMLTLLETIKYGVMVTSTAVPTLAAIKAPGIIDIFKDPLTAISQSDINDSIEYLQRIENNDSNDPENSSTSLDALEGADLRHLEEFIKDKDKHRVLGNLYRIVTPDGHVKWVCIDHYSLAYMEKEQLAFEKAVDVNGGSYEPQLGRVVIKLGSKIRAAEFLEVLTKARRVHDLDITFDWKCSRSDIEVLESALEKSRVSILRLDVRLFQTSLSDKLLLKSRYEELCRIMELPNMKTFHIVLPREIAKLSSFQPKKSSHLHKLSFEMAPILIGEKEFRELTEALKIDTNLTALLLRHSSIGYNGAQALSEALKFNSALTTLILDHSSIGSNGAQSLSEALKINSTLTTLTLLDNSIGDNGAQALSEALKINSTLTTLTLVFKSIGDNGAQSLSEALKINSTLTTLLIHYSSIGDNGAQSLSEALKINSALTTLLLHNGSIGDNGAQALSEALKINSNLTTLDLWYNSIGDNGAQALSEALKINSALTSLHLWYNSIGDNGARSLSEALKINSTLTTLDLRYNTIGDNGAQALSEALKINLTLTKLELSGKYSTFNLRNI
ncbi:hypothetical protein BGZ98_002240 [Dissophora globulifera]|nr:hypothetical protein BGZ98_002240 [Dissophora globulifera]